MITSRYQGHLHEVKDYACIFIRRPLDLLISRLAIECPLWVKSGPGHRRRNRSAFGYTADAFDSVAERPLIARSESPIEIQTKLGPRLFCETPKQEIVKQQQQQQQQQQHTMVPEHSPVKLEEANRQIRTRDRD